MPQMEDGPPTDREGSEEERRPLHLAEVSAALLAQYYSVQYHYVQFLAEHLVDCRKTFGGDFDEVMIIAVLGQRALAAVQDRDGQREMDEERSWMPALRLADVTGIPRESVRRKLRGLEARGWVAQKAGRGWRLAGDVGHSNAGQDLADLDRRGMERLGRLVAALLPLVTPAQQGAAEVGR
jgi:hypothetical protein